MNTADSIRVWQGFMNKEYQSHKDDFYQLLGSVFIPVTSQIMSPLGLQAYYPGILPYSEQQMPDEIALVVYSSQDDYYSASRDTVIGRAYGKLHGDVFNFDSSSSTPASWSKFPTHYTGQAWETHECFYFSGAKLDWASMAMSCVCFEFTTSSTTSLVANDVSAFLQNCQTLISTADVEEIIVSIGDTYCLVWFCCSDASDTKPELANPSENSKLSLSLTAKKETVHPLWTLNDPGLDVSAGNLYNIVLN